jgi:hypothetical protein
MLMRSSATFASCFANMKQMPAPKIFASATLHTMV